MATVYAESFLTKNFGGKMWKTSLTLAVRAGTWLYKLLRLDTILFMSIEKRLTQRIEANAKKTQWLEQLTSISEEFILEDINSNNIYIDTDNDDTDDDTDDDDNDYYDYIDYDNYADDDDDRNDIYNDIIYDDDYRNRKNSNSDSEETESLAKREKLAKRMIRMRPLFDSQPKFETICQDWGNQLIYSSLKKYYFIDPQICNADSIYSLDGKRTNLESTFNLCGFNLTKLDIRNYPDSHIMPMINTNCPNLKKLSFEFKKIKSKDFENVFNNMSQLEILEIDWKCENSNLPITLVKSIEQVGGTLKILNLSYTAEKNKPSLPDSFISVFPRLIVLEKLRIWYFAHLNQPLIQSISEIKNLVILTLSTTWVNDPQSNVYPIGNLKNLKWLNITFDCGVTDELLINLGNNALKTEDISIVGTHITDNGMIALNNLKQLKSFDLRLPTMNKKNKFITDQSLQSLFNEKLEYLDLSNCINVTNHSVLKLVRNLKNLRRLTLENTKITFSIANEISNITKYKKKNLSITVTLDDHNNFLKSFDYNNFNVRFSCVYAQPMLV